MRVVVTEKNNRFYPIRISEGCDVNFSSPPTQDEIEIALVMMALMDEYGELTLGNLRNFIKKSDDKDTFKKQKETYWIIITERCDEIELAVDSTFSYGDSKTCQRDIDLLFN